MSEEETVVIIRRTQLRLGTNFSPAEVQDLRQIEAQAKRGESLTVFQKLKVARAAFRCATRG